MAYLFRSEMWNGQLEEACQSCSNQRTEYRKGVKIEDKIISKYSSILSVGPLKKFYTSPPDRPVHSGTNSASLGSILATQQLSGKTITHIFTTVYSQVLIYKPEWTEASWSVQKCPNFETVIKGDSNPGSLDCESCILPLSY